MANKPSTWTPTKEQSLAVKTTGKSLLVSAAAGSGKTKVLAERCAYLVCDADKPCGVDELLVVTFTNNAAAEMRQRIEQVLRDRLAQSDNPRLARQLASMERAQIGTLHSFCSRILKQNFHLLGIDPNFTTLDEDEAVLLRNEIARDLFADRYADKTAGDFENFVNQYGNGKDEPLIQHVIRTHNLLSSMIDPRGWIEHALARIKSAQSGKLTDSELGMELSAILSSTLADLKQRAISASQRLNDMAGLEHYAEYVNELLAVVQDWEDVFRRESFDGLAKASAGFEMPRLPSVRGLDEALRDSGKILVDSVRDAMRGGLLAEASRFTTEQWRDGLRRITAPSKVFLDLCLEFSRRYRDAKQELRAIDFSDLERYALKILLDDSDPNRLVPTDAARAYHDQFAHVLVDEYQDINAVQDAILSLVSRECLDETEPNLFCVGDVKQSIYRFRLADPTLFLARDKKFRDAKNATGQVIDLQTNFRTRGPLIDVINSVFERLMTRESADILYDQSHALHAGLKYPAAADSGFIGAPVELHLLPKAHREAGEANPDSDELDRSEAEAVVIARRIRQMMGLDNSPRARVFDKELGAMRDIQYRDIVILLRSMKVKADQFAEQLRLAGIPVHSAGGVGFFESLEVRDILSLLRLLDNQQQDVPMAAVLRSPLARLPNADDCLAKVRLAFRDKSIPFHRAVVQYAEKQRDEIAASLRAFLDELKEWRSLVHRRPLAEVLWKIYDETGYLAFCAGLDDGEQRVANLISLHERARQFGTFQRQSLNRFMQFIKNLQDQSDLGTPSVASEADDVVRIMSVHRSKGLEFPVVFLPDLGKRHNLGDSHGMILADREAYLGLQAVDEEKRVRYPSLPWVLVQQRLKRQMLAEELRVLYVAMTRAREHLILIGTNKEESRGRWDDWKQHTGSFPADFVLGCSTMLDWIGPATAAIESARPGSFILSTYDDAQIQEWNTQLLNKPAQTGGRKQFAELQKLNPPPPHDSAADEVISRLTTPYAWREFTEMSAVSSVTGMTKTGRAAPGGESASRADIVAFDPELPPPRCIAGDAAVTPTEVGSATHLVLQYLDFSKAGSIEQIEQQINSMSVRKLMAPGQCKIVDCPSLLWLMQTELGALLRDNHAALRRELPLYFPAAPDSIVQSTDPLDRLMVRGRLDVMLPMPGGLMLADYKTDRVTPETIDARAEFYRGQLSSYADAISRITGQPVIRTYLAFLHPRILKTV